MIQIIESRNDDCLAIEVNGEISSEDVRKLAVPVETCVKSYGKANCLMKVKSYNGFSLGHFFQDVKDGITHLKHFDKIAIVADRKWFEELGEIETYFPTVAISYFDIDDVEKAWEWVK